MSREQSEPYKHVPHEPHGTAGQPPYRHTAEGAQVPSPRQGTHQADEHPSPQDRGGHEDRPLEQLPTHGFDERDSRSSGTWLPALVGVVVLALAFLVGLVLNVLNMSRAVFVFLPQALLALVLCVVVFAVGFWVLRRVRPVRSPSLIVSVTAAVWGASAVTGVATYANTGMSGLWGQILGFEQAGSWGAALTAPLNEELLKLVGVVIIAVVFSRAVRGPVDGFVVGALVGLGFMVVENMFHALNSISLTGGLAPTLSVVQTMGVRVFLTGLGSHWALTGIAGTAVGLVAPFGRRPGVRRVVGALLLVLLAMFLHGIVDAPLLTSGVGTLVKVVLVFVCAMAVYFTVRHTHRRRVREALSEEGQALGMRRSAATALAGRHGRRRELGHVARPERAAVRKRQKQMVETAEDRAVVSRTS